jgi:hypothetical protein
MNAHTNCPDCEGTRPYVEPPFRVREAQSDVVLLWEIDPAAFEIVTLFTRALIERAEEANNAPTPR